MTTRFERRANICASKCTEALGEKCRLSTRSNIVFEGCMILNNRHPVGTGDTNFIQILIVSSVNELGAIRFVIAS